MHDNVDYPSAVGSSMDDSSLDQLLQQQNNLQNRIYAGTNKRRRRRGGAVEDDGKDNIEDDDGEGDSEVWKAFSESFREIQSVLDQNRVLIRQVNENHQSKIPDNLAKNVGLIREINGNISKIVKLYSDLSSNFSSVFHQRRGISAKSNGTGNVSNCKGETLKA